VSRADESNAQVQAVRARVVEALAALGETASVTRTTMGHELVFADGVEVRFGVREPLGSRLRWRLEIGWYDDPERMTRSVGEPERFDIGAVAAVAKRIADRKRQERAQNEADDRAQATVDRLNAGLGEDAGIGATTDGVGGLRFHADLPATREQVTAMLTAARACGLVKS
jgi:hypothetical protein